MGFGYRIFYGFPKNEWIRRHDIRIFRYFSANEWIRRADILIFYDFATGTVPAPRILILASRHFVSAFPL